jgi:hypothetical protein
MDASRRIEELRRKVVDRLSGGSLLLVLGVITLIGCLAAPPPKGNWSFPDGPRNVGAMLRGGGWLGDVAADVVGFRRLVEGRDPYPVLGPAFEAMGIDWPVQHASTHPPTAFLLAAPIANLPLGRSAQVWCVIGFALVFLAMRCYGVPWRAALGIALLAPLWRPAAAAFQNLTFVWLAGVAIAYRYREGRGLASGLGIGVASFTKLLPAGIVLYFLRLGKWRAGLGVLFAWGAALALLLALGPDPWPAYLAKGMAANAWTTILRPENASLPAVGYALGGLGGLAAAVAYLAGLVLRNWRVLLWPERAPEYAFFLYSFLAVALLPIAWGYSATPLLPVLGYFLVRGRAWHVVGAVLVLVGFDFLDPFARVVALGTLGTSILFWLPSPGEAEGPATVA